MKILIVEDEPQLGTYLKRAVEEEGYLAELLANGREAYEYIEDFHDELDLIILDILLPELSGLQICRKIRKKNIAVPVLMLTARDEETDKIEGLDSGADDYLTKPFSLPELLARMRSLIRRAHGETTNMITIEDITIDLKKMQIFKNNVEIFLTLKEYDLLKLFFTYPNQAFSREQILEKVWDMNYTTFSNVVDVHITYLRKKLGMDKNHMTIESVRGVGYRMNVK